MKSKRSILSLRSYLRIAAFAFITPAILFGLVMYGIVRAFQTNTQVAADSAALAAAGHLLSHPEDFDGARREAVRFAAANTVFGRAPLVEPETIAFDRETTRVDVHARTHVTQLPRIFFTLIGRREIVFSATGSAAGGIAGVNSPVVRVLKLNSEVRPGERQPAPEK